MPNSESLVPLFLDRSWWDTWDYPSVLWDQHLGTVLSSKDFHPLVEHEGFIIRPRTRAAVRISGESEVKIDKKGFVVKLNVKHFNPNELEVKVGDNYVVVNGKHKAKSDEHGSVERKFSRYYAFPKDSDEKAVKSTLNSDGILTIEAPTKAEVLLPEERGIPIVVLESAED